MEKINIQKQDIVQGSAHLFNSDNQKKFNKIEYMTENMHLNLAYKYYLEKIGYWLFLIEVLDIKYSKLKVVTSFRLRNFSIPTNYTLSKKLVPSFPQRFVSILP